MFRPAMRGRHRHPPLAGNVGRVEWSSELYLPGIRFPSHETQTGNRPSFSDLGSGRWGVIGSSLEAGLKVHASLQAAGERRCPNRYYGAGLQHGGPDDGLGRFGRRPDVS